GCERDAGKGGAALNKWGCGFTNQRGKYVLPCCPPGIIAASQDQPPPRDLNVPVRLHFGVQVVDYPDLTGRVNAANDVPSHIRETTISILSTGYVRDRMDSDSSLEFYQGIIGQ